MASFVWSQAQTGKLTATGVFWRVFADPSGKSYIGCNFRAIRVIWVKGTDLREKIRSLLGQSADEMGNAQWIGHILKRLQLIDQSRRKHHVGGKLYAIERREVLDMMQRYDIPPIHETN